MALQSSGAISLNDIHIEAGGSSGTQASLNDADIRGLISKASGAQMSFNEWYGASGVTTESSYVGYGGNNTFTSYYCWADDFINQSGYGIAWLNVEQVSHDGWQGSAIATYNFFSYFEYDWQTYGARIKANTPFPAHTGTRSGWRDFGKRLEQRQFTYGDDFGFGDYYKAHRTTGSSYPY